MEVGPPEMYLKKMLAAWSKLIDGTCGLFFACSLACGVNVTKL
jgi:hypothetical protein